MRCQAVLSCLQKFVHQPRYSSLLVAGAITFISGIPSQAIAAGTVPTFDLQANLEDTDEFYNLPYPSDLRLDAAGHPDLSGFPIRANSQIVQQLRNAASDRPGFPTNAVAYFRFNQPIAPQNANEVIPTRRTASILLVDIDPTSPERGRLFPIVASTPRPDAYYVPSYLLAVSPVPGIVLQPDRQYAYVVRRSLRDAQGDRIRVAPVVRQLSQGNTPNTPDGETVRDLYQPLWETLDQLNISRGSVATATVFITGDVVAETAQLSQQIVDRYDPSITALRLDPTDGATHSRFCELQGWIQLPQFQTGIPPYYTRGRFNFRNGQLVEQRQEWVPIRLTLPKALMPEGGYPLMMYHHGSNGLSTQVVDRGPITAPGGEPAPGLGPAHVMSEVGFASVGSALPVNPERFPIPLPDAYLNPLNLAAYPSTFRQGVIEQRLLLEALERLEIAPAVLGSCVGPALPSGETVFRLQTSSVVALGQSHGAQYTAMLAAIDPRIRAVSLTGSGGLWSLLAAENELSSVIGLLLGTLQPLDHLYPGLHLLETAWESADPIVYTPRIARRPLPNQPVRSIYQPVGQGDTEFPQSVFDAMALANGVEQAGDVLWESMQQSLALENRAGILPYPVSENEQSETDLPYTGGVVQYEGDGIADPHTIFSQLDAVKYQYRCFFQSAQATGTAVIPAPQDVTSPCPPLPR